MRQVLETLLDLLSDPSIVELVLSGPSLTTKDFLIGLAWVIGTSLLTKLAINLVWPVLTLLMRRLAPRFAPAAD